MSSSRAGGVFGTAAIPANARKTVQSLKEIVSNSEDEIYLVLKECNMDPNETVQRLLNQDPFHEVKRRRDKKKEWNKESTDSRLRTASGGTQIRGGRDFNASRGKPYISKENGILNSSSRFSNSLGGSLLSVTPSFVHGKASASVLGSQPLPATSIATSSGLQNGNPTCARSASLPQGSWSASTSGHATMADILKANGSLLSLPGPAHTVPLSTPPIGVQVATSVAQQYIVPATSLSLPLSSGIYSSSTDPVRYPSLDPRATVASAAIKREIGSFSNQWTKGEWPSPPLAIDSLMVSSITSQPLQIVQASTIASAVETTLEGDAQVTKSSSPPSVSPPVLQDLPACHPVTVETESPIGTHIRHAVSNSTGGVSGSKTSAGGSFNSRPIYSSHQQPVGTQKAMGTSLEWKPKLLAPTVGSIGGIRSPSPTTAAKLSTPSLDSGMSIAASKLQGVSIRDDQPVIIPNHLLVAETEQTNLSFGSFAAGFGSGFASDFASDDDTVKTMISTVEKGISVVEAPIDQSSTPSALNTASITLDQSYVHQPVSAPDEISASSNETTIASIAPSIVLQPNVTKSDSVVHQGPYYPYLPTIPNYPGFNMVQHVPSGQYTYESAETQPSEVTRLPSLMQAYTDPVASYYTPAFRPGSDGDVRYPSFVTNTSNKYNGNMGLVNLPGQNLPSSQESGNSVLPPVPAVQTSQTGNAQTLPTMAQQPLPLHAYSGQPAGAPLGHHFANVFGYQYMPPSYTYMHSHPAYQHNYTTSSVYPQLPSGTSFPPAASTYSTGSAAVKYQLPQYKPGSGTAIAPHSSTAVGYGGYSSGLSGYSGNPSVTTGSAPGYEDVPQYKDNLYIPSQQVEGSTVWIQAQLSRDMAAGGVQGSSYYNLPGQGQHNSYAHPQQPTHAHPGSYGNLYHPSQAGQAAGVHQLLQQPPALGAVAGSPGGGYHQAQRTQQPWTNSF